MKILVPVSAIDLKIKFGIIPAWWQLLKALSEKGYDLTVIPFYGKSFDTLWWRGINNPTGEISNIVAKSLQNLENMTFSPLRSKKVNQVLNSNLIYMSKIFLIKPLLSANWKRIILKTLKDDSEYSAVLFLGAGLRFTKGLPTIIRRKFRIPVIFMENDMPMALFWKDSVYRNFDLTEFDAFIVTSKGSKKILEERGFHNIHVVYFGVDPSLFQPIKVKKDIDIAFFGLGKGRERSIQYMLIEPSNIMKDKVFVIGGGAHGMDLGRRIKIVTFGSLYSYRLLCCRSKINLNIVRQPFDRIYASSISRPFELGAMGSCVVSNPWLGIEEWFDVGKEIIVVNDSSEAVEVYNWLLSDEESRLRLGSNLREKVLREHTYAKRAEQIISILNKIEN